jgi:anaerobic selenocysteine-containing dehydrogenase
MMMYHAWDSQNAWLRQILAQNFLYVNVETARLLGVADLDWVWVESPHGRVRCQLKTMEGCEPHTAWTWNGIGKQPGAWGLSPDAPEATRAFLLNHLIAEHLPGREGDGRRLTNSDPVTGQAAWFDVKVRIVKCAADETGASPLVERAGSAAGTTARSEPALLRWFAGRRA